LIAYTIDAGSKSKFVSRLIVSTEDEEIAQTARDLGAEVPFMRPTSLATDSAHSLPVVQHAVRTLEQEEGAPYDVVVMLQPTTPLRTEQDIDRGIGLLLETGADSVVSVVDVGANHPNRMKRITGDGRLVNLVEQGFEDMRPRQELPAVYIRSGDLYITRRNVVMDQDTLVGPDCRPIIIPEDRAINVDTPLDLLRAEEKLCGGTR
jgi:CMP-N-acetylneuraminic acid synthetase